MVSQCSSDEPVGEMSIGANHQTQLIEGFKSEHEVLTWFKAKKLTGEQK
ncbi:hypothetical protein Goklo_026880, partial [Gossypium klotzschianum]|nr:hypothetical protein [Gossypium klotzschianum]